MSVVAHWRPRILDASDVDAVDALRASGAVWQVHDTLEAQLLDQVRATHPRRTPLTSGELAALAEEVLDGCPRERFGVWVHYPWSGRLVRLLPRERFRALRADRNRYKLTAAEGERLRGATIGVVGLSVGASVAATLALEGVGGRLKLADFDHLDLSNLNRLRAGVADLGLPKCVLAARQLGELDPWLDLELYPDGVRSDADIEHFLDGLDVLVEECDGIATKLRLREAARRQRIPVVMETSDRGMLDVERFDLEPDRPLLHGLVGDVRPEDLDGLDNEGKATLILRILGARTVSARAAASMMEVDRSITGWPQLASDVALGGAIATMAVRRILLGSQPSGRWFFDPEALLNEDPGEPVPLAAGAPPPPLPARGLARPRSLEGVPEVVRKVVRAACLAPSGGNCQPWHFAWTDRLTVVHDAERARNHLDGRRHASLLALGAALENLELVAASAGHRAVLDLFPRGEVDPVVAEVRLEPESVEVSPLAAHVPHRVTNRRVEARRAGLRPDELGSLRGAVEARGGVLDVCDAAALPEVAEILAAGDRLRSLCAPLHRELVGELRFGPDASSARDGIDVATLELTPFQEAALGVLARPDVLAEVRRLRLGRALGEGSRDAVLAAEAVAVVAMDGDGPGAWLQVGRAVQRMWLTATSLGLGLQPMSALLFMLEVVEDHPDVFTPGERDELATLRDRLAACFPLAFGRTPAFLVRLHRGTEVTARSLRLPLEEVLSAGSEPGAAG